jgi:hypothetical protein
MALTDVLATALVTEATTICRGPPQNARDHTIGVMGREPAQQRETAKIELERRENFKAASRSTSSRSAAAVLNSSAK